MMERTKPKQRYATKRDAEKAVFAMWRKYPDVNIDDLHPYYCPVHRCWHIGSRAKFLASAGIGAALRVRD